jgi:DNA-binding NarL/FixJ family response regulator
MNAARMDNNQPDGEPSSEQRRIAAANSCEDLPFRKIRLLVVDDQPVVRKGLQMLINLQQDMQVCGEAGGVFKARLEVCELHPDLVVVDLELDDGDGFELLEWLRHHHPHIKLLVFTWRDGALFCERAFRGGANGYVVKDDGTQELIHAIRQVMRNRRYISSRAALKFQIPLRDENTR